jgi:hypothetical protein
MSFTTWELESDDWAWKSSVFSSDLGRYRRGFVSRRCDLAGFLARDPRFDDDFIVKDGASQAPFFIDVVLNLE